MKSEDLHKLIELRNHLISSYKKLDGRTSGSSNTAVILQKDVASTLSRSISLLDSLLQHHVEIK
jgi:hypothetical protein